MKKKQNKCWLRHVRAARSLWTPHPHPHPLRAIKGSATNFASLLFRLIRLLAAVHKHFPVNHLDYSRIHKQSTVPLAVPPLDSWRVPRFPGGFRPCARALWGWKIPGRAEATRVTTALKLTKVARCVLLPGAQVPVKLRHSDRVLSSPGDCSAPSRVFEGLRCTLQAGKKINLGEKVWKSQS